MQKFFMPAKYKEIFETVKFSFKILAWRMFRTSEFSVETQKFFALSKKSQAAAEDKVVIQYLIPIFHSTISLFNKFVSGKFFLMIYNQGNVCVSSVKKEETIHFTVVRQ